MFVKGKRLRKCTVYYDMISNGFSVAEAADNFSISQDDVRDAIKWCELNAYFLEAEANIAAIILQKIEDPK